MKGRLALVAVVAVAALGVTGAQGRPGTTAVIGAANDAWSRGDYVSALTEYVRLLNGPDAAEYHDRIALQTGELYQSFELTSDGRNPRFSPDGRFISYEVGLETSRRTRVVRNDASLALVVDLPGTGAAFSPTAAAVAYQKIADVPEIRAAAPALEQASLTAGNRGALVSVLAWHILRNSTIAIYNLDSKAERELPMPGMLKAGLTYSADGQRVFFLGRPELQEGSNAIYALTTVGDPRPPTIVGTEGQFRSTPLVDPSGRVLMYLPVGADQFRRPAGVAAPPGLLAQPVVQPQQMPTSFAVVNLATGVTTVREGSPPVLSIDGGTMAFITRTATASQLHIGPTLGPFAIARATANRLDAPALSPDGSRVAYQAMVRDDWELFGAARNGSDEVRLTRDPQHDLLLQFIGPDRILEVIGEPRHRRSFLIDLKTGVQTRLFHNNTLRTIAPEYQWVVSKDGTKVLIGAERDGNTVSPERGVYLMDLGRKVSGADLGKRLETSLAGERALRETQTRAFEPIAKDVRDAVGQVSIPRIYAYEKALFDFDSKHITRPGNKLASEFLFNAYRSFGYEPEYQWFSPQGALGGQTANVIARLPGTTNPELVYVVSSHYDSVAIGPGADDDSSGTAALLEAARVLAGKPQPATIIFASFTGEEAGLLGSREFVRRAVADRMRIVGALNNDMIGWANDARLDNTIRYSNPGIRDIQHGAAMLFTRLITFDALYYKGTDAMSYYDAYGDIVGGIGSYPVLSSPHYHQTHDLLEFENHELIAETSKTTVATLMRLASSPSRIKGLKVDSFAGGTATLSWDPSPEKGVTSYVVSTTVTSPAVAARPMTVTVPRVTIRGIAPGTVVSVKAMNARGLDSWDAAKIAVGTN